MDVEVAKANQLVNKELAFIDELLNNNYADNAYQKYIALVTNIDEDGNEYNQASNDTKAKVYISFAYFLFAVAEYQPFFEMLIKAQKLGHSRDEIDSVLFEAFVEPNLNEFKTIYENNINFLVSNNFIEIKDTIPFQELPFWLLPTGTINEYYIYDKELKLIQDKISLFKYQHIHSVPTFDVSSDYLLLEDWNWHNVLTYTNAIRKTNKKTYVVINNIGKFLSSLQGALLDDVTISNVIFLNNCSSIQDYFINSNAYLPRNIINLIDRSDSPKKIISDIHNNRIRKENRKGDRVLLSICIPSYNRGARAHENIIHLLQTYYDEEIEIIISNNGTQNETKEYYDEIQSINDARLKYFAFEENMGFAINCCKVCEMASGEFILLLSDEDLVNFAALPSIMNVLNSSRETLAIMKTSTTSQYRLSNIQGSRGKDALLKFMLTSNYISGLIYNNKLLKEHNGINYIKDNLDNSVCYWYPHMFWELLLCQYGNVQSTNVVLINEGKAEEIECAKVEMGSDVTIPYYATIEGRLEQHAGFTSIFKDLEDCAKDSSLLREMYFQLSYKTLFLTTISINAFYKNTSAEPQQLLDRAYNFCSNKEFYISNINTDNSAYETDLNLFSQLYEHSKNQI